VQQCTVKYCFHFHKLVHCSTIICAVTMCSLNVMYISKEIRFNGIWHESDSYYRPNAFTSKQKNPLTIVWYRLYLAYARLCIHNVHSENLPDIRGDILTRNKNSTRCNNAERSCRHRCRTEREDFSTASTKCAWVSPILSIWLTQLNFI